jgi:hypothetical protein
MTASTKSLLIKPEVTTKAPEEKPTNKGLTTLQKLQSRLAPFVKYGEEAKDRVANMALPDNPLVIYNWFDDFTYEWVPAPTNGLNKMPQMAQLRAEFIQKGWQFFPAEEFGRNADEDKPFVYGWEDDGGRVLYLDCWLMYADREIEQRRYRENNERWNERREGKKETIVEDSDTPAKVIATVEKETKQIPVGR